jgi:pyrroline-5-carboxylate reductase
MRLLVIGGGRMGEALIGGLLRAGWSGEDIGVVEKVEARRKELADRFLGLQVPADVVDVPSCDGAVVAVKPADVEGACLSLATMPQPPLHVLSIAAGVRIEDLELWLRNAGPVPVVRAMPNTPAQVGLGAAAISPGTAATEADLAWAEEILSAVGVVVRVPEHLLDAVTGLSGSGPAYVFLVVEAMIEAGVLNGLPRETAEALVRQTLLGAAHLLAEGAEGPAALRAAVTSPGGTTAAGLAALEDRGVRAAFLHAVTAATERSKQLGQS